jgi:hypothetical protein
MSDTSEIISGEDARKILGAIGMALHATMAHSANADLRQLPNGDWLLSCCASNCPIHFELTVREEPKRRMTSSEIFVNLCATLWDPEAVVKHAPNGMSVTTAEVTAQVLFGSVHGQ